MSIDNAIRTYYVVMLIEMKQAKLIQYKTVILLPYCVYMLSIFKTDLSYRILRSFSSSAFFVIQVYTESECTKVFALIKMLFASF